MKYEFLKLLKNKIVLLCILISLVISVYIGVRRADNIVDNDTDVTQYTGELTQEKNDNIEHEYMVARSNYEVSKNRVGEYNQEDILKYATITKDDVDKMSESDKKKYADAIYKWSNVYGNVENCKKSIEFRETVKKNSLMLAETGDTYTRNVNEKAHKMYSGKVKYEVFGSNVAINMINDWIDVNYADYINIICIIIMVCLIFLIEHSSNTYSMIFTSYNGRFKTYFNKSIIVIIISTLLAIITTVINIVPYVGKEEFMQVFKADIQNFAEYIYSPFDLKLYQIALLMIVLRVLAYISIAAVLTFITTFFKKSIVPFGAGTLLFCGEFAMYSKLVDKINLMKGSGTGISSVSDKYKLYRMYTPFGFLRNGIKYFATYEPNNILDKPVLTITIAICVHLVYIVAFFVAGYVVYRFRFRRKGV
ncbi:MAG: hypothetical protein SPL51_03655 [Lachnospiraceae bacterium]|nr:hypothetical protein [Lachnospiraceae bacterium]